MAMLAEKKRKQKWSLNPRGNIWSQDSNKFGQKLMEKMGWTEGKGLGAKENGITEHIKVSYKHDSAGMGFKETDNQWTSHEDNFTELLSSLTGESGMANTRTDSAYKEGKIKSLEKKSQASRARVHYHKYTRGKDLSRYSEKDLANIFGKKTLNENINKNKNEDITSTDSKEEHKFGVDTQNRGSMLDYFKRKMANNGNINIYPIKSDGGSAKTEIDRDSDTECRVGFRANNCNDSEDKANFVSYIKPANGIEASEEKNVGNAEKITKTKKRKAVQNVEVEVEVKRTKKKSKKTRSNEAEEKNISHKVSKKKSKQNDGISNAGFDPFLSNAATPKRSLNVIEEREENEGESYVENEIDGRINGGVTERFGQLEDSPKVKISKRGLSDAGPNEDGAKVKKREGKKKIIKNIDIGVDANEENDDGIEATVNSTEKIANKGFLGNLRSSFRKKKSKTDEDTGGAHQNLAFNLNFTEDVENESNLHEISRKNNFGKKKGTRNNTILEDNNNEDVISLSTALAEIPPLIQLPVKKLKKSKNMEGNNLELPESESTLKKKKKDDEALDESNSVESSNADSRRKKSKKDKNILVEEHLSECPDSLETPKRKKKKKKNDSLEQCEPTVTELSARKKKEKLALDNPIFDANDSVENEGVVENNVFEVKRKKKIIETGYDNPGLNVNSPPAAEVSTTVDTALNNFDLPELDLVLNVVSIPVPEKTSKGVKRKKSGKYNREDVEVKKRKHGIDNGAYDQLGNCIEENVDSITKTLDEYQNQVENDINEAKELTVGEHGDPDGENEKLSDGTKLKFKYAHFGRIPSWARNNDSETKAKRSYRHLIKGDIIVGFPNTNLHSLPGYAPKQRPVNP